MENLADPNRCLLPFDQQEKGEDREVSTRHAKKGNTLKTIEYIKQNWRSISWFCVHWMVQTADELEGNKRKGNNASQTINERKDEQIRVLGVVHFTKISILVFRI